MQPDLNKRIAEIESNLAKINGVLFGISDDVVFTEKIKKIIKDSRNFLYVKGGYSTIKSNAITVSQTYTRLTPESGTADDIDNIYAVKDMGRALITLRPVSGNTITMKDGTGNLRLAGDFAMGSDDIITLQGNGTIWYEVSRSNN